MNKAIALANNDTVFLSWVYDQPIPNCLGFAVWRIDANGTRTPLPAWVGFKGQSNPTWQHKDTSVWPVQKLTWRDFEAKRGATYSYEIVPMTGKPGALTPVTAQTLKTGPVTLTPNRGAVQAYFNRGILSTQALTHEVPKGPSGKPNPTVLQGRITHPGDPLRNQLAGQQIEALTSLLDRAAKEGGSCYLALYELNDPELINKLLANKDRVHLILSNTGDDDAENKPARQHLHEVGADVIDRMVAGGHIGHNKFCLYVDSHNKPKAVLTGSTNWSITGLCTQSNNALIIENDDVAAAYYAYWNRLKADGQAQGDTLRTANDKTQGSGTIDGAKATIWFSPNTKQHSKGPNSPMPDDMKRVCQEMAGAKYAILFLAFQPGNPSIIEYAAACENAKPGLLIYGAATDPNANRTFESLLFHGSTANPDSVVVASAIDHQFAYWQDELLKLPGGHAIIHDKVVVIDPMSDDCTVITGSHNLGYRASYNNDENLVIIKGHKALAQAYATHVMDVYDHYRWRFKLQTKKTAAFSGLDPTPAWQDWYFKPETSSRREALFWTGQLPAVANAPAPQMPAKAAFPANGKGAAKPSAKPAGLPIKGTPIKGQAAHRVPKASSRTTVRAKTAARSKSRSHRPGA